MDTAAAPSELSVTFGAFKLDTVRGKLSGPSGEIQLSPLATRLIAELARTPGQTVERSALITALWRDDPVVGDAALNRLVSEARQALGDNAKSPSLIQTVPRRGYRLVAAAGDAQAATPLSRAAEAIERVSYAKLAAFAFLIVLVTAALKLLLDAAIGVIAASRF